MKSEKEIKELMEQFIKERGWKLVQGKKVNHEGFSDGFEFTLWEQKELDDFISDCNFWQHPTLERVYEEAEDLIDSEYEDEFDRWVLEK